MVVKGNSGINEFFKRLNSLLKFAHYIFLDQSNLRGLHDTSDGSNPHVHGAHSHVPHAPVLPGPQVEHPAPEEGLLEHQPVAVHHVSRLAVGHAVALLDGVAVLHQLFHLTSEVFPLVDPHPKWTSVL